MPEFLIDRNLGRHVLPGALRSRGYVVHTLWSVYGQAEQVLADVDFLCEAGRNGWAVMTADMSIRRRPHELAVVEAEKVQMFGLPRGDLTGADQVARFTANLWQHRGRLRATRPVHLLGAAKQHRATLALTAQ